MDAEKRNEARKTLDALETRRGDLLDRLRDIRPKVYELQEDTRLLRAEREHVSKRIAPIRLLPDEVKTALQRVTNGLDKRIMELDDTLRGFTAQVERMDEELRVLCEERDRLVSLTAPVLDQLLPDELLVEIWNYARASQLTPSYAGIPFPYVASWVTSRWRNTAINTPGLWCDIYVSPYQSMELVRTQLERSKTCSLNVCVTGHGFRDFTEYKSRKMQNLMVVVVANIDRWNSLEIDSLLKDDTETVLWPLRDAYAPRLRHLYMRQIYYPYVQPLFVGGAPMLSHVKLDNISVPPNFHLLRGLIHLDLDLWYRGRPNEAEFRNLLTSCPLLKSLSLAGRCFDPLSSIDRHIPICIPSLRSLKIRFDGSEDNCFSELFSMVSAPGLQSLEVQLYVYRPSTYGDFIDTMISEPPSSRFPILSRLSLRTPDNDHAILAPDDYALRLFRLFPHISNLELVSEDLEAARNLRLLNVYDPTSGSANEPLCPRLATLTWPSWKPNDDAVLKEFITARASMGFPIARLRIKDHRFKTASCAVHEWFSARVKVELEDDSD